MAGLGFIDNFRRGIVPNVKQEMHQVAIIILYLPLLSPHLHTVIDTNQIIYSVSFCLLLNE